MAIRVALSKKDMQSAIALELISLCETVTADGTINDEEIALLQQWLEENRTADLPAIAYLVATVEQILADGKVTDLERRELHRAVERILPPEAKQRSRLIRVGAEQQSREERQRLRQAERDARDIAREAEKQKRPIHIIDLLVVGTRYEGRDRVVSEFCRIGGRVFLAPEPENVHDPHAIRVLCANGMQIGYVPREHAAYLSRIMESGCRQRIEVAKILRGQHSKIPVIKGELYGPDADIDGTYTEADAPAPPKWGEAFYAPSSEHESRPPFQAFPIGLWIFLAALFLLLVLASILD